MRDLDRALADIGAIRQQLAAGTAFQGYGPTAIALTGGLALATAAAQKIWLGEAPDPLAFFAGWIGTACVAVLAVGSEMLWRSRRHHSGLADELLYGAVERFLPAGVAGALLGVVLLRFAPDLLWTLPGLWQLLVSLGLFASLNTLPATVRWAAAWYFVAGLVTLALAAETRALSPWLMGLPFAGGQLLLAALLYRAERGEADHA
ncbi:MULTISPECIES: hypothetical protein [Methylobacterium]|uniref:Uncharacterized protein n=1 Tax=Methylobacterium jeotgali TaxID=381630 RepID=A0ABQ4ST51_9HYPH|nr:MULTISPECIES: hypothetical protein [Methylobacterium]PIU08097.1 MAG: hypothetical protein COT56_02690 [Methylobacterium sp. CG09_land_8_20_14_0_10_71_15]PIU15551.1 MAG: hypothetical protein COT28_04015 [Methylobacterium sp. CG08_land_8_20_14_0_20_71_15]GBU17575.1 hypothetical protein AwMethylo_17900 [Methylobacterium sp.]GJE05030.1 hypothetical protein AOPFMNJM_0325 [Methylobacterium jeotgali]